MRKRVNRIGTGLAGETRLRSDSLAGLAESSPRALPAGCRCLATLAVARDRGGGTALITQKRQRLSPSETRRLVDAYTLYRFGHVLSAQDLAAQAGVPAEVVDQLLAQRPIGQKDLDRIARAIDVSPRLLAEIAGYREMSTDMLQTLDRFFAAIAQQRGQKKARAA